MKQSPRNAASNQSSISDVHFSSETNWTVILVFLLPNWTEWRFCFDGRTYGRKWKNKHFIAQYAKTFHFDYSHLQRYVWSPQKAHNGVSGALFHPDIAANSDLFDIVLFFFWFTIVVCSVVAGWFFWQVSRHVYDGASEWRHAWLLRSTPERQAVDGATQFHRTRDRVVLR